MGEEAVAMEEVTMAATLGAAEEVIMVTEVMPTKLKVGAIHVIQGYRFSGFCLDHFHCLYQILNRIVHDWLRRKQPWI